MYRSSVDNLEHFKAEYKEGKNSPQFDTFPLKREREKLY